jgi:hypothetical protein
MLSIANEKRTKILLSFILRVFLGKLFIRFQNLFLISKL